jgi:signal transduction histidine kinase
MAKRVSNEPLVILMDRARLLQVFRNLIENALQHSDEGTTVIVGARRTAELGDPWVECYVEDSGRGFDAEDLPKVFDPFFTRRRGGIGLGLSIVQRIVEEHKGIIKVGNRKGGGAVVKVKFPLVQGA